MGLARPMYCRIGGERMVAERIPVERRGEARAGLGDRVLDLVRSGDLDGRIAQDQAVYSSFMAELGRALDRAFGRQQAGALFEIHKSLYCLYEQNFATPAHPQAANQFHPFLLRVRNDIERAW